MQSCASIPSMVSVSLFSLEVCQDNQVLFQASLRAFVFSLECTYSCYKPRNLLILKDDVDVAVELQLKFQSALRLQLPLIVNPFEIPEILQIPEVPEIPEIEKGTWKIEDIDQINFTSRCRSMMTPRMCMS
ncbi:hypothetical protein O6H91_02G048000 [Diphasiastrum complanatum]|uniref:Uncharacterized protein n=1 Tax=Diphasiastrum complanatum TaxID=34168 RepID=A0ACC2EF60_DIPCM|nr:hypothetical protein O6H91_02G048000 [Diphasiastrum complanatum]